MSVYFKFLRIFLVLMVGVFFLVGCTPDDGGDDTPVPPKPITVLDSTEERISNQEIKTLLENNETTYTKSFTLDDKKTKVKLSFDLLENNVTKDVKIDVESLDYKEDGLTASILKLSSSTPLKNVDIEIADTTKSNKTFSKRTKTTKAISSNKVTVETMYEAPIYLSTKTNILNFIKSTKLEQIDATHYTFTIETTKHFKNVYCILNKKIFKDSKSPIFEKSKKYVLKLSDIDTLYTLSFGVKDDRYTDIASLTSGTTLANFVNLQAYKMTSDFIGLHKSYTVAEKTLKETRSFFDTTYLNNFIDTAEHTDKVKIVDETVTHRITDFDKLFKDIKDENLIPSKTGWKNSSYTPKGDNGRMPLILVHGWNGDKGMRDPSKLLLWENSEFHYWHNFLSFYLTSEELQKKYHVYLYRYPSYKHVAYNAKIFKELLTKVSSNSDLGKGFKKDKDGITIMAHSMGGMVSRAMIEEFEGLGKDAKKLKKLITLDTPHHGSIGSMDNLLTNLPKDLDTHGAMDLNYDNYDNVFNASFFEKNFNKRRKINGLSDFDREYCTKKLSYSTLKSCMKTTANPYMKYVNKLFEEKKDIYNKKYILYTAWNVHDYDSKADLLNAFGSLGINLRLLQKSIIDLSKNNNPKLDFINNGVMGIATAFIGKFGYSAGGAETVGSSLLASSVAEQFLNPNVSTYPSYSTLSNDLYHKDLVLDTVCTQYAPLRITTGQGSTTDGENIGLECLKTEDISIALITNSTGKDRLSKDNNYGLPYRLFWDYDHETIFNGTAKDRGEWDKYINNSSTFASTTNSDTLFNKHRTEYVQGAMKIRYGEEPNNSSYSADSLNPLTYEPVFLVLEKDLLTSVTNDDIDEDGMKDTWEIENGLRFVNASDANEDSDKDGLTNLEEYSNTPKSTDPQNPDSDGDGFKDGAEVTAGTNPNDKNDYPKEKVEFPLTLNSKTSTHFNLLWTAPTGATKYKLCQSSIDEVSYNTAQTCNNLVDGYFFDSTTSLNMSINSDATGNVLQQDTTYYFRVVAYNDSDAVVGVSSLVSDKLAVVDSIVAISKLKKTGQTKSYDEDGNEVTDGSVKDDGYYKSGVTPSYTRNEAKEIVTDNISKLQWQDNEEAKTVTKNWQEAKDYCSNTLKLGGYSDWRLPTIVELQSIVVDGKESPTIDTVFVSYTTSYNYWSSTNYTSNTSYAWVINFSSGVTAYSPKDKSAVRCVRLEQ